MSIFRVNKEENYIVMDKTALHDERLSWKAKGLHSYMLSMPNDWKFYDTELEKHAKDGKDALKSAIKELKQYGYMKRIRRQNEHGKFDWETIVYERPYTEKPSMEKPLMENPQLLNNKELNINKNIYASDFESFWNVYPRKIDKKKALKSFNAALKRHSLETIIEGTKKYAVSTKSTESQYIKHAATFLNNDSFLDGYEEQKEKSKEQTVKRELGENDFLF